MKRYLTALPIVVLIAAAATLLYTGNGPVVGLPGATGSQTAAISPTPVTVDAPVIAEAVVVPRRHAALSLPVGGIVADIYVQEGDAVASDTPLLQLDDTRAQAHVAQLAASLRQAEWQLAAHQAAPDPETVAQAQAALDTAHAGLQKVQEGPRAGDVTVARAEVAKAEAAVRQAQAAYDDVSWRNDLAMLPQATALEHATQNYVAAQARLDDLVAGASAADVAAAAAGVRAAQAALDELLAGPNAETIAAAEAAVAASRAAQEDAEAALGQLRLDAPFAGQIAAINVEVGEQVAPGAAVVYLADTARWQLETDDLTEIDVVEIAPGDPVQIEIDALPDVTLTGRVTRVRPLGEDKQGDITYTTLVAMDRQDPRLRWNMTAQVTFLPDGELSAQAQETEASEPAWSAVEKWRPAPEPLLIPTPAPAGPSLPPFEPTPTRPPMLTATVRTDGRNLNVRNGPGLAYAIIGSLRPGTALSVTASSEDGAWLRIDHAEQPGWVAADYVTTAGDAADLPVTQPDAGPWLPPTLLETSGDDQEAALSGVLVLQTASGGEILAYDIAAGTLRRLTHGMDPAISPDGRSVAFVRDGGEHGLYLIDMHEDTDGGKERHIYAGGEHLRAPAWSPDGRRIVFSRKLGVYACRAVGASLCYPDSRFLRDFPLVEQEETGLSRVDVAGEQFRDIAALNTAASPSWGAAGIVYQSRAGLQITTDGAEAETRPLLDGFQYADPNWHPHGKRIVFHSLEGNHREIGVVHADGSGLRLLTRPADLLASEFAHNVAPVWSPDGRWIAFLSNRGEQGGVGPWGIWVMDADGGNLQKLPIDVPIEYRFQNEQALSWGVAPAS